MSQVGNVSENLEDYLERIFDVITEHGIAKISVIAKKKGVAMSSVNVAVRRLAEAGLVTHDNYKNINLTDSGAKLASELRRRHKIIKKFLIDIIGVRPSIADDDACSIEHHVHPETVKKLIHYVNRHGTEHDN